MENNHANAVLQLAQGRACLRVKDIEAIGVPRITLTRMVRSGLLERIGRGLYGLPQRAFSEHDSLIEVAHRSKHGVFCLLTALKFHELTSQSPFEIWLTIPNKGQPPRIDYPPLRVVRFSGPALNEGVETHVVNGCSIRVYGVAKTVADCFKYRNKIGLDVALEALREARRDKRVPMDDLWRYAKICRVEKVMQPYLEALA